MSLLSKIGGAIKGVVKGVTGIASKIAPYASVIPGVGGVAGKILTVATGVAGAGAVLNQTRSQTMPYVASTAGLKLPVLPGAGALTKYARPAITAIAGAARGGGLMKIGRAAAKAAGYIISGFYIYDAAGNLIGQTSRRRMNPMNYRALTRACRRVKSAKKILKRVEKLTGGSHRAPSRAVARRKC